jgi:hypothetical protein
MKIIITESQYRFLVENTEVIDDILDKMNDIGYENLESDEKNTLNRYSEWLNSGKKGEFIPEITPKNTNFEEKTGDNWSKTLADGSEFTFQFDYDEIERDVNMYFGVVKWGNTQWFGCIVTEKDGSLALLDFVDDNDDFQTYDSTDSELEFDDSNYKNLNEELGDLLAEVEYFVEDEIIPDLTN